MKSFVSVFCGLAILLASSAHAVNLPRGLAPGDHVAVFDIDGTMTDILYRVGMILRRVGMQRQIPQLMYMRPDQVRYDCGDTLKEIGIFERFDEICRGDFRTEILGNSEMMLYDRPLDGVHEFMKWVEERMTAKYGQHGRVIYVTGRPNSPGNRVMTKNYFKLHGFPGVVILKPLDYSGNDGDYKKEVFQKLLARGVQVELFADDRDSNLIPADTVLPPSVPFVRPSAGREFSVYPSGRKLASVRAYFDQEDQAILHQALDPLFTASVQKGCNWVFEYPNR